MLRGVLVGRRVAAQGGTARLASAQVYPLIARLDALFAFVGFLFFDGLRCPVGEVRTNFFFHNFDLSVRLPTVMLSLSKH
jgi:hypothetical protein